MTPMLPLCGDWTRERRKRDGTEQLAKLEHRSISGLM